MCAGKNHVNLGSGVKDLQHGLQHKHYVCVSSLRSPNPKGSISRGPCGYSAYWRSIEVKEPWAWGTCLFYGKPLCPGERHDINPPDCSLQTQPWVMAGGKSGQGLAWFIRPSGAQGPWWIALPRITQYTFLDDINSNTGCHLLNIPACQAWYTCFAWVNLQQASVVACLFPDREPKKI